MRRKWGERLSAHTDEAVLGGARHSYRAVASSQICEDGGDVELDRALGDVEGISDLLVEETLCDKKKSFEFSGGRASGSFSPRLTCLRSLDSMIVWRSNPPWLTIRTMLKI